MLLFPNDSPKETTGEVQVKLHGEQAEIAVGAFHSLFRGSVGVGW